MFVDSEDDLMELKNSVVKSKNQKTQIEFVCKKCGKQTKRRLLNPHNELLCSVCLAKQTTKERYGVENASQLTSIKEKKKQTTLKNYGVENPMQSKEVVETLKENNLKKYGVEYTMQVEEISQKCTESRKSNFDPIAYQEKFQELWSQKTEEEKEEIKARRKQTCKEKYGNENYNNREKFKLSMTQKMEEERSKLEKEFGEMASTAELVEKFQLDDGYMNSLLQRYFKVYGKYRNYIPKKDVSELEEILKQCSGGGVSSLEKEVVEFVKSIYPGEVLENVKGVIGRKELDIYLPEKNLAIEFNGIYWHSDKGGYPSRFEIPNTESKLKAKTRHLEKTNLCKEKGIRLIHIFEDVWLSKPEIVKSILSYSLKGGVKRIFARKCKVEKIEDDTYKTFLTENCLQEYSPVDVKLGLFYNGELVEVIGIERSTSKLANLCTKNFYVVVGGFSKLLKHSGFNSLTSCIDLEMFNGEGFKKVGFKIVQQTPPTFSYVRLSGKLNTRFVSKNDETEMYQKGFAKIWNCGTLEVKWHL